MTIKEKVEDYLIKYESIAIFRRGDLVEFRPIYMFGQRVQYGLVDAFGVRDLASELGGPMNKIVVLPLDKDGKAFSHLKDFKDSELKLIAKDKTFEVDRSGGVWKPRVVKHKVFNNV